MFIQTSGFTISCSSLLVSFFFGKFFLFGKFFAFFCSSLLVSFVGFDIGFSRVFFLSSIFADCRQPVGNLSVTCR